MLPILLPSLPWRWFGFLALIVAIFGAGCEFGAVRVTSKWQAEQLAQSQAVATQAILVAKHAETSQSINSEVSDVLQKRRSRLAVVHFRGVRDTVGDHGVVPRISERPSSASAATESCVSAADYEQLARDAADDALIIEAWQHWYEEQEAAWPSSDPEGQ